MDTLDRAEADRDDAETELEAVEEKVIQVRLTIDNLIFALAQELKATHADRIQCMNSIAEALDELSYDVRSEIEARIDEAQDALSHAESMDERRSTPVVI